MLGFYVPPTANVIQRRAALEVVLSYSINLSINQSTILSINQILFRARFSPPKLCDKSSPPFPMRTVTGLKSQGIQCLSDLLLLFLWVLCAALEQNADRKLAVCFNGQLE